MTRRVAELIEQLEVDAWRESSGFSEEMAKAQEALWRSSASDADRCSALADWIGQYQPCLFGRMAAKLRFLRFCVIPEATLLESDEAVRDQIQRARTEWTGDAYKGECSGFVVLAVSERIARAKPSSTLLELACRLCSLYLLDEIVPDKIFHDTIELEKPGPERVAWTWKAGVNYFSAQGDQRWWHDHRIPGGIAFSTNSVGHMVKSGILATAMREVDAALGVKTEEWSLSKVDSLHKAHVLAMQTIGLAADTVSGKATQLLSSPIGTGPAATRIAGLPSVLQEKDTTKYIGYYHTDVTVPSEYFRPDVERPADLKPHVLDFSYLFDDSVDNPDHITMGKGRRIRDPDDVVQTHQKGVTPADVRQLEGDVVPLDSCERLMAALRARA